METSLEGTGLNVKGNCLIQELQPLLKSLLELIDSDRNIIQIDLSDVGTIDTAGIQMLASCRQTVLEKGKTFQITTLSGPVKEALAMTGMELMLAETPDS